MNKKKIAVFATGWSWEILYQYLEGAKNVFANDKVDMYLFLCHPTYSDTDTHFQGEVNIFQLPDVKSFDGAMVFPTVSIFLRLSGISIRDAGRPVFR